MVTMEVSANAVASILAKTAQLYLDFARVVRVVEFGQCVQRKFTMGMEFRESS